MTTPRALAVLALWALLLLQPLWHAWLLPPTVLPRGLTVGIAVLPLLWPALAALRGVRTAPFWGAVVALLYFCHGVMEAWVDPRARVLGLVEIGLAVLLVLAVGWDGWLRRRASKAGPAG